MARVYVSIGSNVDRAMHIRSAVENLANRFSPLILSSVYDCPAVGFVGDNFYNLVTGFDTDIPVERLIAELHNIEQAHGRVRNGQHFGSRTLDLDVLLYGDLIRHDKLVDVPRRETLEHAYVLWPLVEIAPEYLHPETKQSLLAHWNEIQRRTATLAKTEFNPLK